MKNTNDRAEFEAWATSQWLALQRTVHGEDYQDLRTQVAWEAYQAGRAALQSQDRDAERYRWLRQQHWNDSELCVVANPKKAVMPGFDCPSLDRLDEAIDHARRIEGEGEWEDFPK